MKFETIVADPSWDFKTYSKKGGGKSPKYPCMKLEDIYSLPVADLAAKDCVCILWVTFPLLEAGIECLKRWGFDYKTVGFVWVKRNKVQQDTNFWGMGFWSRSNVEMALLGTKGKPKRASKGVHQIIETFDDFGTECITSPIGPHSVKPVEVRRRIDLLLPESYKKVVLFGRKPIEGWSVLGNEIDGEDLRDSIPALAKLGE